MGTNFFSRGGGEGLKIYNTHTNGFREGDIFAPLGGRGGQNKVFLKKKSLEQKKGYFSPKENSKEKKFTFLDLPRMFTKSIFG